MTANNTIDGTDGTETDPPIFSALITPHRSLGQVGFVVLMIAFGMVSFFTGVAFLLMGAWPVFGFFGLDVLLLFIAIRVNNKRAAAFEEVTVTPSALTVRKVNHRGRVSEWKLNPLWVRLDRETIEDFGIVRLFLVMRDRQLTIANDLSPHEKESFETALGKALAEARRGPVRTVLA